MDSTTRRARRWLASGHSTEPHGILMNAADKGADADADEVGMRRSEASALTFVVCCNIGASTSFDGCERFFFEAVVVVVNDSAAPIDASARLLFTLLWVRMAGTGTNGTRTAVSAVAASARHAVSAHRCARASRKERARPRVAGGRRRREVPAVVVLAVL